MPIITVCNQKGGVGKSSTCCHLAGEFARRGNRVLILDCEPQASVARCFLGPVAAARIPASETLSAIFDGSATAADLAIGSGVGGLSIAPGGDSLKHHNHPDPEGRPEAEQLALAFALESVASGVFDLVLIDTPPNLQLLTWAALAASDFFLVPLIPEDFSSQGIGPVLGFADRVRQAANPRLSNLGLLIVKAKANSSLHRGFEAEIREGYGPLVLETRVPDWTVFAESITGRLPIAQHEPRGRASAVISALADEIQERLDAAGRLVP